MTRAACTIVSPNYLAFARTVAASYLAQHPGHQFFVLIVANLTDPIPFEAEPFTPVLLYEIGLPNLLSTAMMYELLELNTNVKPTFLKHLLTTHALDTLIYLDPDIFCYAPFDPVYQLLDAGASAVLTPHITTPVYDGRRPTEQDLLVNGTYNLGFIALRASGETTQLLTWWEARCLHDGFDEGRTGLFLDQKWMNLAPGLFPSIAILRDPGCNMAYWNLHERKLAPSPTGYLVESPISPPVPLRFYHFSRIFLDDPFAISRNTNRFRLPDRPDLKALFADYKVLLKANANSALEAIPYGFDRFSDGTIITVLARRLFAKHQAHFPQPDPFNAAGGFANFARDHNLVQGTDAPARGNWSTFDPQSFRVAALHSLLKFALRFFGPHKYELLMRYLSHISVLRHQSSFLRDPAWQPDEMRK